MQGFLQANQIEQQLLQNSDSAYRNSLNLFCTAPQGLLVHLRLNGTMVLAAKRYSTAP